MHRLLLILPACSAFACLSVATAKQVPLGPGSVAEAIWKLKPGDFIWEPRLSPKGPLLLIVNATTQRALLFRNGVPIAASTVSTGRPGYRTPTGIFTVLQKRVEHYSSKYDNAPMPYMQRLTWGGIALHAGNLPGYPASHGCIRLPLDFARKLYGTTNVGMTVFITNSPATPRVAPDAQSVFGGAAPPAASGAMFWAPERATSGPLSILVSAKDNKALVLRNGVPIGAGEVRVEGPVEGTFAYVLQDGPGGARRWLRIDFEDNGKSAPVGGQEWKRFAAPKLFRDRVAALLQPGTTIVVTPDTLAATPEPKRLMVIEGSGE